MESKFYAFFSHKTDDWSTPKALYNAFMSNSFVDPCPIKSQQSMYGKVHKGKRIYINPPFSQNEFWVKYAVDLARDNDVWLLIPCRTDTRYFRYLVDSLVVSLFFITGRVCFNDTGKGAPFPVVVIHLNTKRRKYYFFTQDELIDYILKYYESGHSTAFFML